MNSKTWNRKELGFPWSSVCDCSLALLSRRWWLKLVECVSLYTVGFGFCIAKDLDLAAYDRETQIKIAWVSRTFLCHIRKVWMQQSRLARCHQGPRHLSASPCPFSPPSGSPPGPIWWQEHYFILSTSKARWGRKGGSYLSLFLITAHWPEFSH